MAEWVHAQRGREIWITRAHLGALGVATFFIALLAFFVGMQVGRTETDDTIQSAAPPLIPDANREDALEALLREVEAAQVQDAPLSFPEALQAGEVAEAPPKPEAPTAPVTEVEPPAEASVSPPPPLPLPLPEKAVIKTEIPEGGWAVQIASYDNQGDATSRVTALQEVGLSAYSVAALVNGRNWFRVRIVGFQTREEAVAGRTKLSNKLGVSDLMVAKAP